jgi:hypothetical protein
MITDELLVQMYARPMTMAQIGREIGVTTQRVQQRLKQLGVVARRRGKPTRMIPDTLYQDARAGATRNFLAKKYNVAASTVSNRLHQAGIDPRLIRAAQRRHDLVVQLRALGRRLRRTPSVRDIAKFTMITPMLYVHYFGSYAAAQKLAGFIPNPRGRPENALSEKPPASASRGADRRNASTRYHNAVRKMRTAVSHPSELGGRSRR